MMHKELKTYKIEGVGGGGMFQILEKSTFHTQGFIPIKPQNSQRSTVKDSVEHGLRRSEEGRKISQKA